VRIESGCVVVMGYRVSEYQGDLLEKGESDQPMVYLHGHRNILPGLEAELTGKAEGDEVSVVLPPERAYGLYREDAVDRVPIKHLLRPPKRLKAGDLVRVNTKNGARDARVIKVGRFNVDLDSNHPYAGKTLQFDLTIERVRAATPEEIAHGHSHGGDGTAGHA